MVGHSPAPGRLEINFGSGTDPLRNIEQSYGNWLMYRWQTWWFTSWTWWFLPVCFIKLANNMFIVTIEMEQTKNCESENGYILPSGKLT
jgi:hypothetical protein